MREGTLRNLGHSSAVLLFLFLLLILSLVSANFTFASSQITEGQFPQSIIAASSTDSTPHALELRAIQDGDNAEPRKVSQFKLDMTNVVTAQVNSQVLVFVTDSSVRVLEAKVRTVSDQLIDLVPSIQANTFSLANLPVGVYTLDIISQKGNAKAAYEGILVISQQPTTIINETTRQIINQEINQNSRIDIDTKIIFKDDTPKQKPKPKPSPCYFDPSLDECKPKNGKCPPGLGFNDDDQCVPIGKCPPGYGRLDDDETGKCYKKSDIKKCPDGYIVHKNAKCPKPPVKCQPYEQLIDGKCQRLYCRDVDGPIGPGGCPVPPIPGKGTCLELYGKICCNDPAFNGEGECYDEGDFDDCEDGFIDRGYGCKPIEGEGPEPEICTPDDAECPPCPEGVEAGWCADEDERQDTDDCPDEKPGDECYREEVEEVEEQEEDVNDVEENEEEPEETELEEQEEEEEESEEVSTEEE